MKSAILAIPLMATTVGIGQFAAHVPGLSGTGDEKGDVLGQLFGGGRKALSCRFVDRADLYFHGGVHEEECDGGLFCDEEHDHDECDGHDHSECSHGFWGWLNGHIHPTGHAHLKGERCEKEVVPWLWAATAADPHNVDAYLVGAYWLSRRMNRPADGLKLLRRGIEANPAAHELDMARAEIHLSTRNNEAAADALVTAEEKWHARANAQEDPKLRESGGRILVYMGVLAERRGDIASAAEHYRQALPLVRVKERIMRRLAHAEKALAPGADDGLSEQG